MGMPGKRKFLLLLPQLPKAVIFLEEKQKEAVNIPIGFTKNYTDYKLKR